MVALALNDFAFSPVSARSACMTLCITTGSLSNTICILVLGGMVIVSSFCELGPLRRTIRRNWTGAGYGVSRFVPGMASFHGSASIKILEILSGTPINLLPIVVNCSEKKSSGSRIVTSRSPLFSRSRTNVIDSPGDWPTSVPDKWALTCRKVAGGWGADSQSFGS